MNFRRYLLFVLIPAFCWQCKENEALDPVGNSEYCYRLLEVHNQPELDQLMENVTAYSEKGNTSCLHLSLVGGNVYMLDVVKLMNISLIDGGSLIMESNDGVAEINCTASYYDVDELREVVRPISGLALVLLDGLLFDRCPVPLMIEETSNVTIRNCVFQ